MFQNPISVLATSGSNFAVGDSGMPAPSGAVALGGRGLDGNFSLVTVNSGAIAISGSLSIAASSDPSVGTNYLNAPSSSVLIGGYDGEFLSPIRIAPGSRDLVTAPKSVILSYDAFTSNNLDINYWTTSSVFNGTASQGPSGVLLQTLTSSGGTIQISTKRIARALNNCPLLFSSLVRIPDGNILTSSGNSRRWGMSQTYFTLSGGSFYFSTTDANAVTSFVGTGSWNNSSFTMDNNFHLYEILLYENQIYAYVDKSLVHSIIGPSSSFPLSTLNGTGFFFNSNTVGQTTNRQLEFKTFAIARLGNDDTSDNFYYNITTANSFVIKLSPGILKRLIVGQPSAAGVTMTFYDATSASNTLKIAAVSLATATTFEFDMQFARALSVVVSAGTQGDYTIIYR